MSFFKNSFVVLSQKQFDIRFKSEREKREALNNLWDDYENILITNELYDKGENNYKLAFNKFNILSVDEFADKFLGVIVKPHTEKRTPQPRINPADCQNLPAYKNWAKEMKLSPVQNQGNCGSCYLFSALAILEAHTAIEKNLNPVKLSAQHALECVKTFPDIENLKGNGCGGGRPEVKVYLISIQNLRCSNLTTYFSVGLEICKR